VLKTALHRFSRGLLGEERGPVPLPLPAALPASLGCDAVGIPARHGFRLMARLPRTGCVFADDEQWWWIVPAGSDLELTWPSPACYVAGTSVPAARRPRLIHWPDDRTPYTPPIPLYLMVCQLSGTAPSWAPQPPRTVPARQRG
jgi:hypothetical protein